MRARRRPHAPLDWIAEPDAERGFFCGRRRLPELAVACPGWGAANAKKSTAPCQPPNLRSPFPVVQSFPTGSGSLRAARYLGISAHGQSTLSSRLG
ncbi:Hypothetical predicted protein, partial [Podarcis lilfordi]